MNSACNNYINRGKKGRRRKLPRLGSIAVVWLVVTRGWHEVVGGVGGGVGLLVVVAGGKSRNSWGCQRWWFSLYHDSVEGGAIDHSGAGEGVSMLVAVFGNAWGGGCGGEREKRCWIKKTGVRGWFLFNFGLYFLYAQTMKSTPIYMRWKKNILSLMVPNLSHWFNSEGS